MHGKCCNSSKQFKSKAIFFACRKAKIALEYTDFICILRTDFAWFKWKRKLLKHFVSLHESVKLMWGIRYPENGFYRSFCAVQISGKRKGDWGSKGKLCWRKKCTSIAADGVLHFFNEILSETEDQSTLTLKWWQSRKKTDDMVTGLKSIVSHGLQFHISAAFFSSFIFLLFWQLLSRAQSTFNFTNRRFVTNDSSDKNNK